MYAVFYLIGAVVVAAFLLRLLGVYFIMELNPGGVVAWLIVGLIAGWLAGVFIKGSGFGVVGDIIVGIVGALIGGLLFSLLAPGASVGLVGSIVVAFVGACILLAIARALPARTTVRP
jgi:uncharacterized membrane protein YeaQ/YmgE (transglycosylase-associated protein family)